MKDNILFLDLDGVLLPFGSYDDLDTRAMLQKPLEFKDALVERTPKENIDALHKLGEDHTFVLISTWRYLVPDEMIKEYMSALDLWKYFHKERPIANFSIQYADKPVDINRWLAEYEHGGAGILVIDDWDMTHHFKHSTIKQIAPDPKVGYLG